MATEVDFLMLKNALVDSKRLNDELIESSRIDWHFEKVIDKESVFVCKGEWIGNGIFLITQKAFLNANDNYHTPAFFTEPRYATASYDNGALIERRNYNAGQLDSETTLEPSIELIDDSGAKRQWHQKGKNVTAKVRYFCLKNTIDINNMSNDEKMFVLMNLSSLK